MATAGYQDTKEAIINTLMGRAVGHEIQPDEHQDFALKLLDYIHSVELISGSTLIGIAEPNTVPLQPDDAHVAYISGVGTDSTFEYLYFIDSNGVPLVVTTTDKAKFVIFIWNTEYWSKVELETTIELNSYADKAYFYYNLVIQKTYSSVAKMEADSANPIGDDGKEIQFGELVSVVNMKDETEDAIYSRIENGWRFQTKSYTLSSRSARVLDGGRADTNYGGCRMIDCGDASTPVT